MPPAIVPWLTAPYRRRRCYCAFGGAVLARQPTRRPRSSRSRVDAGKMQRMIRSSLPPNKHHSIRITCGFQRKNNQPAALQAAVYAASALHALCTCATPPIPIPIAVARALAGACSWRLHGRTQARAAAYHQPSTFHQAMPMTPQVSRWRTPMMAPNLNTWRRRRRTRGVAACC